jgi:hypothetical protein
MGTPDLHPRAITYDLLPAVRRGDVVVKLAIERLSGNRACFLDGSEETADRIIVVRVPRLAIIWDCVRRRDGYAAAALDA